MHAPQLRYGSTAHRSPRLEPVVVSRIDHLHSKLVAKHARIAEKRLAPAEGVQIGSANADAMDADESLTRTSGRQTCVCGHQLTGRLKGYLEHAGHRGSMRFPAFNLARRRIRAPGSRV